MKVQIVLLLLLVASVYGKEFTTIAAAADADLSFLTDSGCVP
jgi:hypothetical protein